MKLFLVFLVAMCAALANSSIEQQLASVTRQRVALGAMEISIGLQQTAIRKQANVERPKAESFFIVADPERAESAAVPNCAALSPFEARGMVEQVARKAGLDPNLLSAVAMQESAFRPCAVSAKGAQGIMQLMPATAMDLGVKNPLDAAESLAGGAALLKQLMLRYSGDLNRVLGAYNAGPGRVDAAGGVPQIPETMNYVDRILGKMP